MATLCQPVLLVGTAAADLVPRVSPTKTIIAADYGHTTSRQGPLAGIVGALGASSRPLVAVIAGDMPSASAAVFRELAAAWAGEPAVVGVTNGVPQPLHAVYATDHLNTFRDLFDCGERSPRHACSVAGARFVALEDGSWCRDVDTPTDLDRLTGASFRFR
jgi:molybdopterin-guanine dinucleotide biosynthesis protein A